MDKDHRPLEDNKKPLRFLRYFLMARYKKRMEGKYYPRDEIYDWLKEDGNAEHTGYKEDSFGFVERITSNVKHYINFSKGRGKDDEPSLALDSIKD